MTIFEEGRGQLLSAIDQIPEGKAHRRISEDSWSIVEVLEHLILIEKVITKNFVKALNQQEDHETPQHPVHLSARPRPVVEAPDYVVPAGRYETIAEAKGALHQSRIKFKAVLENIEDQSILDKRSFPHPIFGEMQLAQWIDFIGYHEQRHRKQIEEILAKAE
ncbi:DinB family protein [Alkalihalobacillus sp. AL-G]|uniref:DinB family protein n=1 Tax=Alkalihalobacillus sp. AL-G TaxID=2926399 RepID=UPI00272B1987|nr:DinB family protein [Alkalihalobacillus sp. AL-G]WLD92735.1 DinB family protein [Alkalihalobacillus sp. AL-G]